MKLPGAWAEREHEGDAMKDEIKQIIGKTISGVIVKEMEGGQPTSQVFLLFSDNTSYEFYSYSTICGAGGVDPGGAEAVRQYIPEAKIIYEAHGDSGESHSDGAGAG